MKIYGIVTDAAEEKPLAKSKVVLYIGEMELVTFYSDKDGKFQVEQKLDQHIGETLICHVEKDNFKPREVTYKIEDEDIRLDIELVPIEPEKSIELPKKEIVPPPPNMKWLKIAIGIAAVIVVAIGAYFVISHERRPEPAHKPAHRPAPRPGEVRVPQRASSENLIVTDFEARVLGATVRLHYSLKAEGQLSGAFNMGVFISKGANGTWLRKWGLPSSLFDQLRSGQTISQAWTFQIPNWGEGIYNISIHADIDNFLTERNENDNTKTKSLNVVH